MNIIQIRIQELKSQTYRPKKWEDTVWKNLKKKKTPYSISTIQKVFRGDFFNETVALKIIAVFETEKRRQADKLKKITK